MNMNDLYEAGDQIKQAVQNAVDSKNFTDLSNNIAEVVDQTMDTIQAALREGFSSARNYQRTNSAAADRIRQEMEEREKSRKESHIKNAGTEERARVSLPGSLLTAMQKWLGYGVAGACFFSAMIIALVESSIGINLFLPISILGLIGAGGLLTGWLGKRKQDMVRRLMRYLEVLGTRKHCQIDELAATVGKSTKFVRKDLRKMIEKGMLRQGHLDLTESMLIVDDEVFRQYLNSQNSFEQRRMQEQTAETLSEDAIAKLSPECRALIKDGQRYIQHIKMCNDKIPGKEMTEKLSRLETVVARIFAEVEKNPGIAGDLHKMMSYYLPTTQKLLDTYCELEMQPIQGENIDATKAEIETALDTLGVAFENLLDSFFQTTAWDISTDISVLNTMLAQEGLAGGTTFPGK